MAKLADALRGAADRAPVADVHLSTSSAAARVRRHRGLRGASTGLVGASAVAVIAFGALGAGGVSSMNDDLEAEQSGPVAPGAELDVAGETRLAGDFGWCGTMFEDTVFSDSTGAELRTTAPLDYSLSLPFAELTPDVDPVALIDVVATADIAATTPGPTTFLLFKGQIVGFVDALVGSDAVSLQDFTLFAGDATQLKVEIPAVDCAYGETLPAGEYELVVVQEFWPNETAPEPVPEPTIAPDDAPSSGSGDADASDEVTSSGEGTEPGVVDPTMAPLPIAESLWATARTTLQIPGDAVDNPFGDDWPQGAGPGPVEPGPIEPGPVDPAPVPPLPDNYLSPAEARDLYDANATTDRWTMAAGTQRWVMTGSSAFTSEQDWNDVYYGCSWGGTIGATFPQRSADLDLLSVEVTTPRSVGVSYGFVVDGNPELNVKVTNTSEYALPGFWNSQPSGTLYLVQNGRVMAEAYLTNLSDRGQMMFDQLAAQESEAGFGDDVASSYFLPESELLEPGAVAEGQFLWRDVNGCGDANGSASLAPGTYTVLHQQWMSINPAMQYGMVDEGFARESEAGVGTVGEDLGGATDSAPSLGSPTEDIAPLDEPAIAPSPLPDQEWDYAEFQVWTSLGEVTVTVSP